MCIHSMYTGLLCGTVCIESLMALSFKNQYDLGKRGLTHPKVIRRKETQGLDTEATVSGQNPSSFKGIIN